MPAADVATAADLMKGFAERTGLEPESPEPRRYLWTDAFAVCNFLALHARTGEERWLNLALKLIDQVHRVLGRHRPDDPSSGWISGLAEAEGARHPTAGGLRIGKPLPERPPGAPPDERLEWDRDGQYYHYLTKWMHALNRTARLTGRPVYNRWARELARTAHAAFLQGSCPGPSQSLSWKMSIDLRRPLVPSMGQHDPLDGLITFQLLRAVARCAFGEDSGPDLRHEIAELAGICRGRNWTTTDPLGIGGLLFDAARIAQLKALGPVKPPGLMGEVLRDALAGIEVFVASGELRLPAGGRLPFRELGLAIGLKAAGRLREWITAHPVAFRDPALRRRVEALVRYAALGERILRIWLEDDAHSAETWSAHREINEVMLATALVPEGFLSI